MMYEFTGPDGERIEVDFPMGEAPSIGETIKLDGEVCVRIASMPEVCGAHDGSTKFPRFESHQLPRNWKHHKGEFGPTGKPRFANRSEVDEAVARASHDDTTIEYGAL